MDGAAFPAVMLTVAVSPINFSPHERDDLNEGERLTAEVQVSDPVEQELNEAQEQ